MEETQINYKPYNFGNFETRRLLLGSKIYDKKTSECYQIVSFVKMDELWVAVFLSNICPKVATSEYLLENFNYLPIEYHDRPFGEKV